MGVSYEPAHPKFASFGIFCGECPSGSQQAQLTGAGNGFCAAADLELAEDVAVVAFDRVEGDVKRLADLAVGEALGDQGKNLKLT